MTIYVQWRYDYNSKTYLVIFHLLDDYSRPNLRRSLKLIHTAKYSPKLPISILLPECSKEFNDVQFEIVNFEKGKTIFGITWAPTHPELALLTEILCYANIINGFKEDQKKQLLKELCKENLTLSSKEQWEQLEEEGLLIGPDGVFDAITKEYLNWLKEIVDRKVKNVFMV